RSAFALLAAACASPRDAASSGLLSTARRSPLCTACPARTATEASRPVISGATRISVCRTMPAIGGVAWWLGQKTSKATTHAAPMATSARMRRFLSFAFTYCLPAEESSRGQRGEPAVEQGQGPQPHPVVEDIGDPRIHLVDAHQPVDCRRAGKDETR